MTTSIAKLAWRNLWRHKRRTQLWLGVELAKELDVRVGERLAIDVQSLAGSQGAGLRLVGLIESNVLPVDKAMALVHVDDARGLTGVATPAALRTRRSSHLLMVHAANVTPSWFVKT